MTEFIFNKGLDFPVGFTFQGILPQVLPPNETILNCTTL